MSSKGTVYERELCQRLSLWWSEGKYDDLFWRTGGSGGRARVRAKKGKRTTGQHGDIGATDPDATILIKALTIEIKRGYSKFTFADVMDKPPKRKGQAKAPLQAWEKWVHQIHTSFQQALSVSWLMIQRRDKRRALVFFPHPLYVELQFQGCFNDDRVKPSATIFANVCGSGLLIHCLRLDTFLDLVRPDAIRTMMEQA